MVRTYQERRQPYLDRHAACAEGTTLSTGEAQLLDDPGGNSGGGVGETDRGRLLVLFRTFPVLSRCHHNDMEIAPFELAVPQTDLDDLARRLDATRWPVPLPGDDWNTGVPVEYLRRLAAVWRDQYDWRASEARLNAFPQFITEIDETQIHYLHARSPHPGAVALLLTHGWPGSVFEFLDVIGPLTQPDDPADAFHVVVPSLPGFGLSGPTKEPWNTERIARGWATLMEGLGYERFAVQGGDIGAAVSPAVAQVAPDRVLGVHINGSQVFVPPDSVDDKTKNSLSPQRDRLQRIGQFMQDEYGYIAIQSTRPQTLAYGLIDSPVGQLAWIRQVQGVDMAARGDARRRSRCPSSAGTRVAVLVHRHRRHECLRRIRSPVLGTVTGTLLHTHRVP